MGLKSGIMRISDKVFDKYFKDRSSDKKQEIKYFIKWKEYLEWRNIIKTKKIKKEDEGEWMPF